MSTTEQSNVITQDVPRPPDNSVTESDSPAEIKESRVAAKSKEDKGEQATPTAATDSDKEKGANDQDSATGDDKPSDPPKRKRGIERRIERLSRKLADAQERENASQTTIQELQDRLDKLESQQSQESTDLVEPDLKDFKTPQQYAKAYAAYERKIAAAKKPAPRPEQKKPASPAKPPELPPELQQFHKAGRDKYGEEFDEALQEEIPVNQFMGEYILDHDSGIEIYMHLANNPEEAHKIANSSPYRAAKLLDSLATKASKGELDVDEGQLQFEEEGEEEKDKPKAKGSRKQTKAGDPPNHKPESSGLNTDVNMEELSMDEYAARRQKQELRKLGYTK